VSARLSARKRCGVAVAGMGLAAASVAGAGAAQAARAPRPHHHARGPAAPPARTWPDIAQPPTAFGASSARTSIAREVLAGGPGADLPTVTVTDPGVVASGDTLTLDLASSAGPVTFDTAHLPVVTRTGSGVTVSALRVNATAISFTATKGSTATTASYAVSGISVHAATASSGALRIGVTATHLTGTAPNQTSVIDAAVRPFTVAAVTYLLPALYGPTAEDTAAQLFTAHEVASNALPASVVLASSADPQDAETANYLAAGVPGQPTGVLLTGGTRLSPAVRRTFAAYPTIGTGSGKVYLVGGTSVLSAAVEDALISRFGRSHVVRISGATQYDTNTAVISYSASIFNAAAGFVRIDYSTGGQYNDTAGSSSPATTTTRGSVATAIVASGEGGSYQDAMVSSPLSYSYAMPVILTAAGRLSDAARTVLLRGGYQQVIVLGGPLAVSDTVVTQLTSPVRAGGAAVTVFRVAGVDASDTSQLFARFLTDGRGSNIDMNLTNNGDPDGGVFIARGTGFQDVLAAGPYAGYDAYTPILLTRDLATLGAPLTAYLAMVGAHDHFSVHAIGGPLSVPLAVQHAAIAAEVTGLGH